MRLYLLRHGDAPFDHSCGERVLSEAGKTATQKIIQRHSNELVETALIVCSPTRRARETLAVLTQTLNYKNPVLFDDCLRSGSSVAAVERYSSHLEADSLVMISHQPLVGYILDYLTDRGGIGMQMGTSCLARLELLTFSRGCGSLDWLDRPELP